MKTLPDWATQLGFSIDYARRVVRERPDLKALGTQYGATRVYVEPEARQIAEAVGEWAAKRRGAVAATAS